MNEKAVDYLEEILNEEQLALLNKIGYFTAPASVKNHLNIKGGLAQHSVNVTDFMINLNESMNLGLERSWLIQMGMLHDLSKVGYYEENILKSGKQSELAPYRYRPSIILPHGMDSVYIAINELKLALSVPVVTAITYHSGAFTEEYRNNVNKLKSQPIDMLCQWLLHTADMYASYIQEVKFNE